MDKLEHIIFLFVTLIGLASAWYNEHGFYLDRRNPYEIGTEDEIHIFPGEPNKVKTLSVNPPIFEVKNFLTTEECNYLIHLAEKAGLEDSPLHMADVRDFHTNFEVFDQWDVNNDSFIEPIEFTYIKNKGNLYLTEVEVMGMMENLNIDQNGDNKMDYHEFEEITAERIGVHFKYLAEKFPKLRSRLSKQTWLYQQTLYNTPLDGLHVRMSKLTGLPHELIDVSEPMQVVKYEEGGHYYCHQDSDEVDPSLPCCTHLNSDNPCRQCRYLTIMFFLNNVTRGGQTVFPIADNETFSVEHWEGEATTKCNLVDNCEKSNLVVEPLQGTALLWYNHYVDNYSGWLGELDPMTYHGGCDVVTGEKWIANTWLNVIGKKGTKESKDGWLSSHRPMDEL